MQDESAVLEPQDDASASAELDERFGKSVDTGAEVTEEPVEAEAEAEETETEPESEVDSSPAEEEDLEEKTDPQPGDIEYTARVKERIDELTGKYRELDRASAAKDQEIAALREQLAQARPPEEPFKTIEDFDYDQLKWQEYIAGEVTRRAETAAERVAKGVQFDVELQRREQEFADRERKFAETVKDYDEVAKAPSLRISESMATVMKGQENGPELAYYLGNEPEKSARIASLPPEAAGFELGLISAYLAAEKAKARQKPVTKAPPPPPKIKAGDAGLTKDPADMTDREFRKWREKQIANR